ncbi:MAG: CRISPR-associated endonuclease Cas2 [Myxococcales bacterium]|nr:CRISPR-associated endonuclease Cas2 [Myxococcales bacterium]
MLLRVGVRIQLSVFELWVTPAMMAEVVERLGAVLHPQEDRVDIIPVCGRCAAGRSRIGCARAEEPAWRVW